MAYFNGHEYLLAALKGDSCFIRFSANADGSDFTETRQAGQTYIGIAAGQTAPTDKSAYIWVALGKDEAIQEALKQLEQAMEQKFTEHDNEEDTYRKSVATTIEAMANRIYRKSSSYAIPDLSTLSDLLFGKWVDSTGHSRDTIDLQTGDTIHVAQRGVPDFWFEQTNDASRAEDYIHTDEGGNETIYTLRVCEYDNPYKTLGVLHKVEYDYSRAEEASQEAANSRDEAQGHAQEAANSAAVAERSVENTVKSAIAAANYRDAARDHAKEAKETADGLKEDFEEYVQSLLDTIEGELEGIIAIQESLIGGEGA